MATLKNTRLTVHICNIIISILCVLSIAAYFISPLWQVDLRYKLTAETLEPLLSDNEKSLNTEGTASFDSDLTFGDSEHFELDFKEVLGDEGIDLHLSLTIKTKDVLSSLYSDPSDTVHTMLGGLVNEAVGQIIEPMHEVARKLARVASRQVLHDKLREHIRDGYGGKTEEEIDRIFDNAGISDEYIDNKVDSIIESLYKDGANVGSVSNDVISAIEDALNKVHQSDPEQFKKTELNADDRTQVRKNVEDALKLLAEDDGSINVDNLIADMVLEALGASSSSETTNEEPPSDETASANGATPLSSVTTINESSIEEVKIELQKLLAEKLEKSVKTIASVLKYISFVLLFTFFTWAYLIIKILCKIQKKNNAIKLKLPIWLGTLPAIVLWLLPTLAMSAIQNALVGTESGGAFSSLALTFSSGATFSFFVAVFFIFFSLLFYGKQRGILRRYQKGLLKDTTTPKKKKPKKNPYENDLEFVRASDYNDDVCVGD